MIFPFSFILLAALQILFSPQEPAHLGATCVVFASQISRI